ncbi:MAG: AAA family ATPase [Gammaproteobacteria bacterium]|jgi:type II secretory pathway predicted ATPase ExeA
MYKRFYQLDTNPFRLAPEPEFCFSHSGYRRAREYLEFALAEGEGFVMVTGRPGTGKTMLVETFLKEVKPGEVVARRIAVSNYGATELLRAVAYAYGIDATGMDKGTMRHRIQQFFVKQEQIGRRVLLIIDEAQALSHAALEELRILADLQTQSRLMLQLFLVGQESLQELMRLPDMEQFQQRVIANYKLEPLNLEDSRAYIEHRLLQAGWLGDPEFSSAAVLSIYQLSNGVPRHINKICNRLLLLGFGKGSHTLDEQDVLEISAEMREEQLTPMAVNQATLYNINNVTNLPEIRNDPVAVTDLSIRREQTENSVAGNSEDWSQDADIKEAFIAHHHVPPASNDEQITPQDTWAAAYEASEPSDTTSEVLTATDNSDTADTRRRIDRPGWKKALAIPAVLLVLLTVIVAALPSFPGREGFIVTLMEQFSPPEQQLTALSERSAVPDVNSELQVMANDARRPSSRQPANTAVPTASAITDDQQAIGVINRSKVKPEARAQATPVAEPREQTPVILTGTVEQLLAQGQQALADYRLLTPEGDNAYEYLLAVLQLDPANEAARAGIQEIVDIYITLAAKATDSNELARAERYLERGLGIQADNPELLALQDTVNSKLESAPLTQAAASAETHDNTALRLQPALTKRQPADRRRNISDTTGLEY